MEVRLKTHSMENDYNKIILIDIHSYYMLDFSKYRQIIFFSCQYNNASLLVYNAIDIKSTQTTEDKVTKKLKRRKGMFAGGEGGSTHTCSCKKNKGVVFWTTFLITWRDHWSLITGSGFESSNHIRECVILKCNYDIHYAIWPAHVARHVAQNTTRSFCFPGGSRNETRSFVTLHSLKYH